jgi:hypothetical protein
VLVGAHFQELGVLGLARRSRQGRQKHSSRLLDRVPLALGAQVKPSANVWSVTDHINVKGSCVCLESLREARQDALVQRVRAHRVLRANLDRPRSQLQPAYRFDVSASADRERGGYRVNLETGEEVTASYAVPGHPRCDAIAP